MKALLLNQVVSIKFSTTAVILLLIGISAGFAVSELVGSPQQYDTGEREWMSQVQNQTPETATFAGGCFWCIEEVYQGRKGVSSAVSGFTGGEASTATYRQVASGGTNHREAVQIKYYPSLVSYDKLLDMYWTSIDPTDAGGQFSDRGYQYTTGIYAHNARQYRLALESKENLSESGKFDEPIVTEVKNITEFYRAADKHQNYSMRNTYQYKAYKSASGRTGFIDRVWE